VALARWKDLCLDAIDPAKAGGFWSAALGMRYVDLGAQGGRLAGHTPEELIWINRVPEAKTVKNRVHLDLRCNQLQPLLDLGASVHTRPPADNPQWWVLADPEGNEFCVSLRGDHGLPAERYEIVVDCVDPWAQATWWAAVFSAQPAREERRPWAWVADAPGLPYEYLVFNPVPEPKTVKNRMHWDVWGVGPDALAGHGARLLRAPDDEIAWHVFADPEGNEFCVFAAGD
jgi:hypothetical protein